MGRREWRSSKSSLAAGFGEQETVPPTGQKVRTDVFHDIGSSIHTHVNSHTYKYTNIYIIQISTCPHTEEGEGERTRER